MELEQEVQEEEHSEIITTPINKTSQSKTYGYHRKKKKSGRRRLGVLLLLTPFLIAATVWIYRSVHTASLSRTNATFAADISGLAYMMPEKVLRQADCGETVFSDNSNDINIDDNDVHDGEVCRCQDEAGDVVAMDVHIKTGCVTVDEPILHPPFCVRQRI